MAQIIHNISSPNDGLGDPIRTAFDNQNAMNSELYSDKVDKIIGKGLSSNDYTTDEKDKLSEIEEGAEVNVQADWNQSDDTQDNFIKNKPDFVEFLLDSSSAANFQASGSPYDNPDLPAWVDANQPRELFYYDNDSSIYYTFDYTSSDWVAITPETTDNLPEGDVNLYATNANIALIIEESPLTVPDSSQYVTATDGAGNLLKMKWTDIKSFILTSTYFGLFVHSLTNKSTPVDADEFGIADSADSYNQKRITLLQSWNNYFKSKADSLYQTILTDVNFGSFINGLTGKTTPIDADSVSIVDSADSNKQKKVSLTNFKTYFKSYFDTLYVPLTRTLTINGISFDLSANRSWTVSGGGQKFINMYHPSWNLTNLNTWRSWGRNTSNILTADATASLGTGSTPSSFADFDFIMVEDCSALTKMSFSIRENAVASVTVQIFLQSFDLINNMARGSETNVQTLINETVSLGSVSSGTFKNNFTIAAHTLNASSGLFLSYRITSGTGATPQGVAIKLTFS